MQKLAQPKFPLGGDKYTNLGLRGVCSVVGKPQDCGQSVGLSV